MDFISLSFGLFLLIGVLVYYCIPKSKQWIWLLILGMFFYGYASKKLSFFISMSILTSYLYGIIMDYFKKNPWKNKNRKLLGKLFLFIVIAGNCFVLLFLKISASHTPVSARLHMDRFAFLLPIGISFYTLQIVAYCVDVYKGKITPQHNIFKYALFVTFFPQILQGPIPRYEKLGKQLYEGHTFDYQKFTFGLQLMLWGFFQKLVIADRANIVVNRIFGEYNRFTGFIIVMGAFLYSIQLYADFSGCVCIAKGSAALFGIEIEDNFMQPYFATSVADFWHRWHISLSTWLRDYIYIPLGGNRKGKIRKYVNVMITFMISGIWHGIGTHFFLWGFLHGIYQVIGSVLMPVRDWIVKVFHINREGFSHKLYKQIVTFVLVMFAWLVFRVDSISQLKGMLHNMFMEFNPWIFVNGDLYLLGISGMEFRLLLFSIFIMWCVSMLQVKFRKQGSCIRMELAKQSLVFRWIILFVAIFSVIIFGVYGPGYDAAQFIYGGF